MVGESIHSTRTISRKLCYPNTRIDATVISFPQAPPLANPLALSAFPSYRTRTTTTRQHAGTSMAAEKTLAIVLRTIEFSESSYIVTLYTPDFGRVSALAKGAKRPKSPFESALDLLTICRVVFLRKTSDGLDLLTEARLEHRFRAAATSLSRLYGAMYIAELLLAWTDHCDINPSLFWLSHNAIRRIDDSQSVPKTLLHYEIRSLQLLGLLPSLQFCVECGATIDSTRRAAFGIQAGGVLCDSCKRGQRQVISISSEGRSLMVKLATVDQYQDASPTSLGLPASSLPWGELRGILNQVIAHQLERRPRLFPLLVRYCYQDDTRENCHV